MSIMHVETLIAALSKMDPTALVLIEGAGDTYWMIASAAEDGEGAAILVPSGRAYESPSKSDSEKGKTP